LEIKQFLDQIEKGEKDKADAFKQALMILAHRIQSHWQAMKIFIFLRINKSVIQQATVST
jgi:hypothetical protein